jgi:hypothetical protein
MSHDTEATSSKRKYDSAIDTSCAFETNDLNLTTANFDSYGDWLHAPCRSFKIFQMYQYFTIYRQYFFLKIEHFS